MKLLMATCLIICLVTAAPKSKPKVQKGFKELDDSNFEHDTQASTGSTTGDWFILFCGSKSKHCRTFHPMWQELYEKLYGRVTCAWVDL